MYDFDKNFIFLSKNLLSFLNKHLYPASKKLILLKKVHSVKFIP